MAKNVLRLSEAQVRNRLATRLGAQDRCEYGVRCGRPDVSTDKEIIEVKRARLWKAALGQVLAYHFYAHDTHSIRPRIHLFGPRKECKRALTLARPVCQKHGVRITAEVVERLPGLTVVEVADPPAATEREALSQREMQEVLETGTQLPPLKQFEGTGVTIGFAHTGPGDHLKPNQERLDLLVRVALIYAKAASNALGSVNTSDHTSTLTAFTALMTGSKQIHYLLDTVRVGALKCRAATLHEAVLQLGPEASDTNLDAAFRTHGGPPVLTMTGWDRLCKQKGCHLPADARPFVELERRAGALAYAKRMLVLHEYENLPDADGRWRTCLAAAEVAFDFPASLCMSSCQFLGAKWSDIRKQQRLSADLRNRMVDYAARSRGRAFCDDVDAGQGLVDAKLRAETLKQLCEKNGVKVADPPAAAEREALSQREMQEVLETEELWPKSKPLEEIVKKHQRAVDAGQGLLDCIMSGSEKSAVDAWQESGTLEETVNKQVASLHAVRNELSMLLMRSAAANFDRFLRDYKAAFEEWIKSGLSRSVCPESLRAALGLLGTDGKAEKTRANRFLMLALCLKLLPNLKFAKFKKLRLRNLRSHAAESNIIAIVNEWFVSGNNAQLKRWGVTQSRRTEFTALAGALRAQARAR